jgi:maltose alpha-D-glucosyltransferase/alpha-amylase
VDPGPLDFGILDNWRQEVQWHTGDAVLLCEANVSHDDLARYCAAAPDGPNDRAQMMFAFNLNAQLWLALARRDAEPLVQAVEELPRLPAGAQWATFLRNHDELDLSKLTEEQRNDVLAEFAPRPDMRIYQRGIRRRLATMMKGDRRRIELAYSLQFSLPGTPVLLYGEEIGMGENLALPGREAIRTPMQWDGTRSAGFSSAPVDEFKRPLPRRSRYGPRQCNVRDQSRDRDSLLRWVEQLIRVLRECPEIGTGAPTVLDLPLPRSVLALRFDALSGDAGGSVLLLHNLADQPVTVDLAKLKIPATAHQVFADSDYPPLSSRITELPLAGWGYRWIRLSGGF